MPGIQDRMMQDVERQSHHERRGSPYARPARSAGNARPPSDGQRWQHDRFQDHRGKRSAETGGGGGGRGGSAPSFSNTPSAKLAIQGLHYEVTEEELKDLFERIGPTTKCFIRYDRSGRSTGAASVTYSETRDAIRAKQEYDGANAKGQPISIAFEIIREQGGGGSGNRGSGDLFNRLGGGPADALARRIGGGPQAGPPSNAPRGPSNTTSSTATRAGPHRSVSDGRRADRQPPPPHRGGSSAGRGHGGRRGGRGGGRGPAPTADSLDAELDAFMQTPSGASESVHAPKEGDTDMQ